MHNLADIPEPAQKIILETMSEGGSFTIVMINNLLENAGFGRIATEEMLEEVVELLTTFHDYKVITHTIH